jgi:signal transduction histidine kinase
MKTFDINDVITHGKTIIYTSLLEENYFQFLISGVSKFSVCQVYGRDITDLKAKEKELKAALVKAEEAKKLKEQFLAQISHEIRSPLNVIVGYADLLKQDYPEKREDFNGILRSIKNNSKRLYRTFDLLLNMSQLQTSKYETRFEKVDLYSLLLTVKQEFQSHADEKNLELDLINNSNGDSTVTVDHYSVSQLFSNLVDNAIKYTEKGKNRINLEKRINQ